MSADTEFYTCDKFHNYIVCGCLKIYLNFIKLTSRTQRLQSPHGEVNLYRDYSGSLLNYCVAVFIRKRTMFHAYWGLHLSCRWEDAILNYSHMLYTVQRIKLYWGKTHKNGTLTFCICIHLQILRNTYYGICQFILHLIPAGMTPYITYEIIYIYIYIYIYIPRLVLRVPHSSVEPSTKNYESHS
jgi:hypothetical protein